MPHDVRTVRDEPVRGVGVVAGAALGHRFAEPFLPGAEELGFILAHEWRQLGLMVAPDDDTDAEAMAAITRVTGELREAMDLAARGRCWQAGARRRRSTCHPSP